MIQPSRRQALHALVATAAAGLAPLARAAAPMAGSNVVGVHRMKLGAFEVTTLLDGYIELPQAVLQGNAEVIQRAMEAGRVIAPIRTAVNCFLVNTGAKLVMVEADVDYWGSPAVEAAAPENQKGRFVAAKRAIAAYGDRLQPFELGAELVPGIRSVPAAGHTPGHSCYLVGSGSARLLLLGDTLHVGPVQFARPEITVMFDFRQDDARARRQELFEMAVKDDLLIGAVHLPFPGIGKLRARDGGGYVYEPMAWQMY